MYCIPTALKMWYARDDNVVKMKIVDKDEMVEKNKTVRWRDDNLVEVKLFYKDEIIKKKKTVRWRDDNLEEVKIFGKDEIIEKKKTVRWRDDNLEEVKIEMVGRLRNSGNAKKQIRKPLNIVKANFRRSSNRWVEMAKLLFAVLLFAVLLMLWIMFSTKRGMFCGSTVVIPFSSDPESPLDDDCLIDFVVQIFFFLEGIRVSHYFCGECSRE